MINKIFQRFPSGPPFFLLDLLIGENRTYPVGVSAHNNQSDDLEYNQLVQEQIEENTYIEYFVADPDIKSDEQSTDISSEDQTQEPMKITIEYIASGNKDTQSKSKRKSFYSKLDNMKSVDEVLGDLRSYKDRLLALDFKKEEKVSDEEIEKE